MEAKDVLGTVVEVGDRIAYARVGSGSDHGSMAVGRVLELLEKPRPWAREKMMPMARIDWEWPVGKYEPKRSTISKFQNLLVIHKINGIVTIPDLGAVVAHLPVR